MTFDKSLQLAKGNGGKWNQGASLGCFQSCRDLSHLHVSRIWKRFLEGKIFFSPLLLHSQIYMENSNITKINPALKISVMTFWCHILKLNLLILQFLCSKVDCHWLKMTFKTWYWFLCKGGIQRGRRKHKRGAHWYLQWYCQCSVSLLECVYICSFIYSMYSMMSKSY